MSGPIDEEFAELCLPESGRVLEFGCSPGVFTSRIALARPHLDVTGIDLYLAEVIDGYTFVLGDVLSYEPERPFDVVICVSSFEHCGIETINCQAGGVVHLDAHLQVAEKLTSMLVPGGLLAVTCPLGPDGLWLTREGGEDFRMGEAPLTQARWGYRTFSIPRLKQAFGSLRLLHDEAHEHTGGDYFDRANWAQIDPERDFARYDHPSKRAVLCAVFEKGGY